MNLNKSIVLATLMAASLFSACVHAQSKVALSGIPGEFVGRQQYAGQVAKKVFNSGGLITSRIAFTGSEDLCGGPRANFNPTQLLRLDTGASGRFDGDAFWGSRSTVGISGPFSEVNNSVTHSSSTIAGFRTTPRYGRAETFPSKGRFGYSLDHTMPALGADYLLSKPTDLDVIAT